MRAKIFEVEVKEAEVRSEETDEPEEFMSNGKRRVSDWGQGIKRSNKCFENRLIYVSTPRIDICGERSLQGPAVVLSTLLPVGPSGRHDVHDDA